MQTIFLNLSDAWSLIQDGDLLLWRGRGLIGIAGRGIHRHAATAAWWGDDLMVLDTHWRRGGDCRQLVNDVRNESGMIDWFEANAIHDPRYDRAGVVKYMRRLVDTKYGFYSIVHAARHHLPIVRLFANPEINDDGENAYPPYCSEGRSRADRIGGGCDPVSFAADRITEPSDLARSSFYRYRGTLVWDDAMQTKTALPLPSRFFI